MSSRSPFPPEPDAAGGRDRGMTLVELLIGITLTGVLTAALGAALSVTLRAERPTQQRIAESSDVMFLQTWVPVDLSSAIAADGTPTLQPASSQLLPGTNVVTLTREDPDLGGTYLVAYRYEPDGDGWAIVRYEIHSPGTAGESVTRMVVAHAVAAPPAGWTPDQPPTFAVQLRSRNQVVLRPIGEDMEVTFASGNVFTTGGAGLSSNDLLPTDYRGGIVDPSAPPSRCGGTVALVLDTSGSISQVGGDPYLEAAATGLVDAFTGTPTLLSITGFSRNAYALYPTTAGSYISLLNPSAEVTAARTAITNITYGGTTNWEDGLWLPFRESNGTLRTQLADLVVFVTDGDPNRNRTTPGNSNDNRIDPEDVSRAATMANDARATGARVVGVYVGASAADSASVSRLKSVVGNVAWTGTGPTDIANAASADYFIPGRGSGDWTQLGSTLKAIMAAQCGGTVTVQKRIDVGGTLQEGRGVWSYTTETGVRELDLANEASITFDYPFPSGSATRPVQITEQVADGYVLDRVECSAGGVPLDASRQSAPLDGAPGVALVLRPDEAVSCIFVSRPA